MARDVGKSRKVLMVGGGIGGLAAAAGLASLGFQVQVLEQAEDFREVGAGIQIAPNGSRALQQLGLLKEFDKWSWKPPALVMRDGFDGTDIVTIGLGDDFVGRFEHPYAVIHRADLLGLLLEACRRNSNIDLATNSRVEGIEEPGQGVRIRLADGRRFDGDALIGADGLRSAVRRHIMNDGLPPAPKYIVYRGVVPREQIPDDIWAPEVVMWTGPNADFVHYPLRSGELFNLVVTFKADRDLDPMDIVGSRGEMLAPYAGFHPTVHRLLELLTADRKWMVTDRTPTRGWSRGAIAVLGDAAHPMLQYMAQGACQALEDVAQLIEEVRATSGELPSAFEQYAEKRYLRTARVQFSARQMIELCQVSGLLADLRARHFGSRTQQQLHDGLAWLYSPHPGERFS
ncbi:FAD-dependent monooxygenase [Mesorhizobium sp. IMUNJ 23232]|uniref:FAD-dependent monooxygenase n=1 Tax=Mesorhizobium sp. IMUNJ 23232 TaxID=3376064 RepID=UPI0037916620